MVFRSLSRLLALAAAPAFLYAGVSAPQPAPYVTGRVIDGDSGQAVAGATIHVSGRQAITLTTDADGRYQSGTLLPGMYSMTVTRAGYLPAVSRYADRVPLRLRVREDAIGPAIVRKDWMLERAARITGRVLSETGDPVPGVTVVAAKRASGRGGWPELTIASTATTRADGRFQIADVARGTYVLAYQLPVGGVPRWFYSPGIVDPRHASLVEAVVGRQPEPIDLRGSSVPFPDVKVSTRSPTGGPAAHAAVELAVWSPFPSTRASQIISTVTDSAGRGSLAAVPVGRHDVRARTPASTASVATARAATVVEIPAQLAGGLEIRLQQSPPACLFTRWENDGARQEDYRSPPLIRATTSDGALADESLVAEGPVGGMLRLPGLLPGSLLRVAPFANVPIWAVTRFSPERPAPRGLVPIDAAAAGCTAAYFRRTSEAITGRVDLGDLEWVPDVELLAIPIGAPSAPIAASAMMDDGNFHLGGIALGIQYDVIAVPTGYSVETIPSGLRQIIKASGGNVITIPLSLPIAR